MAATMPIPRLVALLAEAMARGATGARSTSSRLVLERSGRPSLAIDFARRRLVALAGAEGAEDGRARTGRTPSSEELRIAALAWDEAGPVGARRSGNHALVFQNSRFHAPSLKELLVRSLGLMERLRPGTLETLAAEKGRTKRVVARRPEDLYGAPRREAFAVRLDEWWVATNNSSEEVRKYIRRAAFHAGLEVAVESSP